MNVVATSLDRVPLLKVTGDVDHLSGDVLPGAIRTAFGGHHRLLLDLSACWYMDSGGLAGLLWVIRDVPADGWLGVLGVSSNLARMFEIVGLSREPRFRIFASLAEARKAAEVEA